MRMTQRKFKEYVEKNLTGITDRELFTSEYLRSRLERMATAITDRYKRPVRVRLSWGGDAIAYTDHSQITINPGFAELTRYRDRPARFQVILGLLAHEIAHILYSDFKLSREFLRSMSAGRWYPNRPSFPHGKYASRVREIEAALAEGGAAKVCDILRSLLNILEDQAIELRMKREYPGSFAEGLRAALAFLQETSPSFAELRQLDVSEFDCRLSLIFRYTRFGIRDFSGAGARRKRWMIVCQKYLEQGIHGDTTERIDAVNHLLVLLWPYIALEDMPEKLSSAPLPGCAAAPEGETIPVPEAERQSGEENAADCEGEKKDLAEMLGEIQRQIAADRARESSEKENHRVLTEELEHMDLKGRHSHITSHIYRDVKINPSWIQTYRETAVPLLQIARRMSRQTQLQALERGRGAKKDGLYWGRLNSKRLHRDDGKRFYRRKLPAAGADLAISVLVDESGSMVLDGRISRARDAAVVLYSFCRFLEIPVSVYGHSADQGHDLELYSYAEFDSIDDQDCYRLMNMQLRYNNRDGAAVSYMAQRLLKRPEENRMLFILTDGIPYAAGYAGNPANQDLSEMVRKYERQGIVIYALAIGDDSEQLRRIYGTRYLDVRDLNRLPQRMVNLVKQKLKD